MTLLSATEIRITGTVQGVGFRPTVWRLASEEGLVGEVLNDSAGVLIRTVGAADAISRLLQRIQSEAPPLSRIETVRTTRMVSPPTFTGFVISESVSGENRTRVAADAAVCAACRAEVLDPAARRCGYPFANCTHCGPRFSIVQSVPYDRPRTSMAAFPMCSACAAEYADPADRRFHAQPIACVVCGPRVWLEANDNVDPPMASGVIAEVVGHIRQGLIVAMRGLGGFHLVCDAGNASAVRELRSRKHRYGKPLALMARDLEMVARYCTITPLARRLLESPEAPIVLLPADGPESLPEELAPRLQVLGFMLPYTPLHLLVMEKLDRPVVMTSANLSHEPQVTANEEARQKLGVLADVRLMHNRDIANRIDDSVVRVVAGRPRLLRRARGYAPGAIALPAGFEDAPDLLAYGGELKSTFCLMKSGAAILSQHQGDLEDMATSDDYQKNLRLYAEMYNHVPRMLVADLHPEYLSTKIAQERAELGNLELTQVQHHHAHLASCMAENGVALDTSPILGVIIDGLGFGEDGTLWGGEFLLGDYRSYRRVGSFKPVAMLGGAQSIREPWRNTYAHLVAAMGWPAFVQHFGTLKLRTYLQSKPLAVLDRMLARGLNTPLASSCGRLFDGVAAALGMCADRAAYEGQGAMELEAAAARHSAVEAPYPFVLTCPGDDGFRQLDAAPMWWALAADLSRERPVEEIAARFHEGLTHGIASMVRSILASARSVRTVALSGGCFQNALLLERVVQLLEAAGLSCLTHEKVPANDGGLALGQAAIVAARHILGHAIDPFQLSY